MANAETEIKIVEFIIESDTTHCNLLYTSNEPGTPWGGGWKTKTFGKSKTAVDILENEISEYLMWSDGRELGSQKE